MALWTSFLVVTYFLTDSEIPKWIVPDVGRTLDQPINGSEIPSWVAWIVDEHGQLHYNECLCTRWPYSQSPVVLCSPKVDRAGFRIFNCLSSDEKEITVSLPRQAKRAVMALWTNWLGQTNHECFYFHAKVRHPYFYLKGSDHVYYYYCCCCYYQYCYYYYFLSSLTLSS